VAWTGVRRLRRGVIAAALAATASCNAPVTILSAPTVPLPLEVGIDEQLADAVPEEIADDGVLDIATDPSYRPMEYLTSDGRLTGVDVALAQAIAAKLGLLPVFTLEAFNALEPGVRAGRFELAVAGLSVGAQDSLLTDAVLYLDSGTRLARSNRSDATLQDLCGRSIAALEGSAQLAALAEQSERCRDRGAPGITLVAGQTAAEVTRAVLIGKAEALVGDSPVVQASVRSYSSELQLVDGVVFPAPLAMLVSGPEGFVDLVAAALNALIEDGTYAKILASGGIVEGAVAEATVLPMGTTPSL
jgi:polar amino acid transport system substrate-binding protein